MTVDGDALASLTFGGGDSESEPDLDRQFIQTEDFDRFLNPSVALVLGPKGAGKSALFELFAKYGATARQLAGDKLNTVIVATGSGFNDVSEITPTDLVPVMTARPGGLEQLWVTYYAVRLATELRDQGFTSAGPLKQYLRASEQLPDRRILGLLRSVWTAVGGDPPESVDVMVAGSGIKVAGGARAIDALDLLEDIDHVLGASNRRLWLLFDKLDEMFAADRKANREVLESMFAATKRIRTGFRNINPRIFLRTDIWRDLEFAGKSYLDDKQLRLSWNRSDLARLLLRRATASRPVTEFLAQREAGPAWRHTSELSDDEVIAGLHNILPPDIDGMLGLDWILVRITDASAHAFPRELIGFGNLAREWQSDVGEPGGNALLSQEALREAFPTVSQRRCESFLTEFPDVKSHLSRFAGLDDWLLERADLRRWFEPLEPSGDDAIMRLYEVGVLEPVDGHPRRADRFTVPMLYRPGFSRHDF
jgi:hypothetical protein